MQTMNTLISSLIMFLAICKVTDAFDVVLYLICVLYLCQVALTQIPLGQGGQAQGRKHRSVDRGH